MKSKWSFFVGVACLVCSQLAAVVLPRSQEWVSDLYVHQNTYDSKGRYIQLNDGSWWDLNYTYDSCWDWMWGNDAQGFWLKHDVIQILSGTNPKYPYVLYNVSKDLAVEARQFEPSMMAAQRQEDSSDSLWWLLWWNNLSNALK